MSSDRTQFHKSDSLIEYPYASIEPANFTHSYLFPAVRSILNSRPPPRTLFDLGCGNGVMISRLSAMGYLAAAVDTSESGIRFARIAAPAARIEIGSAYDDLAGSFGRFDVVVCFEVIEHLISPATAARTIANLLNPGGVAVVSTPYHGYLKNIAISAAGKWDLHHSSLWEGGHVKFWSRATLRRLFDDQGLSEVAFHRVGRIPQLAKSMVGAFARP